MLPDPNVVVDIFRGFNVASPYPLQGTRPDVAGVAGQLRHHLKAGRFGYQEEGNEGNKEMQRMTVLDSATPTRRVSEGFRRPSLTRRVSAPPNHPR